MDSYDDEILKDYMNQEKIYNESLLDSERSINHEAYLKYLNTYETIQRYKK